MAILSKIRERSLFLILVIGLALFAFVLDPSKIADFFNSRKVNEVGQVNGEGISRKEFAEALENYRTQTGGRVSEMQSAKAVWNSLVREKIYKKQLEEAGITIGEEDIMNSLYENPSIQKDPRFQTTGVFDKNKFKEYLASIKEAGGQEWEAWQSYMKSIETNLQKTTYDKLVAVGVSASLKEGETQYKMENTKINAKFVYIPFTSVADSLITIKKSEVEAYINKHKSDFEVDESRDIKFVKFDIKPTTQDEEAIKTEVAKLLEDREEYSNAAKAKITVKGLKNTTNAKNFLEENKSDLPLNKAVQFKSQVSKVIADAIFNGEKGSVFGPYKDNNYYKISKITEVLQLPDSATASHILIPYTGAASADADVKRTKEEAKKTADSLLTVVKLDVTKFADLAKDFSSDKGSANNGGKYDWFPYNRMTPAFRDFCFEEKEGSMGVVETPFGYHVIKVDGQKNLQKAVKLATFARKIEASETTENNVFQNAETFALEVSKGKNFDEIVKEKKLTSSPAQGIKALDENVPGLGKERQVITWAFNKDSEVGNYKRFDVDGGYVVAVITGKTPKGLMPVDKAITKVRPILLTEKKVAIIEKKMNGATLEDIAKENKQNVRTASSVNLSSPTISGVGYEPKVVGAMVNATKDKLYNKVIGDRGVYAFKVTNKEQPIELQNYDSFRNRLAKNRKNNTYRIFEALKKSSKIEDGLSSFYGIQ